MRRVGKSVLKGVLWELIGLASLWAYTGDPTLSVGWAVYRAITFVIYERMFKRARRSKWWFTFTAKDNVTSIIQIGQRARRLMARYDDENDRRVIEDGDTVWQVGGKLYGMRPSRK